MPSSTSLPFRHLPFPSLLAATQTPLELPLFGLLILSRGGQTSSIHSHQTSSRSTPSRDTFASRSSSRLPKQVTISRDKWEPVGHSRSFPLDVPPLSLVYPLAGSCSGRLRRVRPSELWPRTVWYLLATRFEPSLRKYGSFIGSVKADRVLLRSCSAYHLVPAVVLPCSGSRSPGQAVIASGLAKAFLSQKLEKNSDIECERNPYVCLNRMSAKGTLVDYQALLRQCCVADSFALSLVSNIPLITH